VVHGPNNIVGHLLGVAEQRHRAVLVEQRVVDAGIAGAERELTNRRVLALSTSRIGMP
jgi:hypothetical protein